MTDKIDSYLQTLAGRGVPASQEAEEAVIGAVLINPSVYIQVAAFLKPEDFYFLKCAYIWGSFDRITKRNDPIDYLTVIAELNAMGWLDEIGGAPEITRIVTQTPTSIHADVYGQLVRRDSVRRGLLNTADLIRGYALDTEIELSEVISKSQDSFAKVLGRVVESRGEMIDAGMETLLNEMEAAASHPHNVVGTPTGYTGVDELLGGLEDQDLIVVAARPGAGKSALCGCLALNMAKAGFKVGFFPNEMSTKEFNRRALAIETGINSRALRRAGNLTTAQWGRVYEAMFRNQKLPIYIDDVVSTPAMLRAKAKQIQSSGGLDVMVVDGMFRMPADSGVSDRLERFSELPESMKNMAKDLDIPIIVTHQLNRDVKNRNDKRPVLTDLRDSGVVEQEADQVWFVHREVMYDPATEFPNGVELIVAKNRDGATGMIPLHFEQTLTRFSDAVITPVSLKDHVMPKYKAE